MQNSSIAIALVLVALQPCHALVTNSAAVTNRPALQPEAEHADIAEAFAKQFPGSHLSGLAMDDVIASRTWTNYITSLDPDHSYFLASDLELFRKHERQLDDQVCTGNVAFAFTVFEVLKERVRGRCEYVDSLLERGFDLDRDESYVWRRKDRPWPADEEQRDDLWRRRVKDQYIRRLLARENGAETNSVDAADQTDPSDPSDPPDPTDQAEEPAPGTDEDTEDIPPPTPEESISKQYRRLLTLLEDSEADWVLEKYLTAFARSYDPHSEYMSPSSAENFNIEMKLSLEGIGALLRAEDGMAKVMELIPGGPADQDGRLKPGDKIIAVGQGDEKPVDILHWPLSRIVSLIRGPKGTKVLLVVIPATDRTGLTTKKIDIIRDRVKLEERAAKSEIHKVEGADGVERELAVITVPAFYANASARFRTSPDYRSSADDVRKLLKDLNAADVTGVVLDLRNNGGGYLPEAVKMAGLFLRTGPVVQVRDRQVVNVWRDTNPLLAYKGSLVVLVNRISASASEIVAGALQDYNRAVIVGDHKTHGKGTVQRLGRLAEDGNLGSVKVTNASYYRVSGSSTQKRGVVPDIIVPSAYDHMEYGEDTLPNPIPWSRISPVEHADVADLSTSIPLLRERSQQRRADNPRMTAYARLLDGLDAMSKRRELPLNIGKRRKLAESEKELIELQNELATGEAEGDKEENGDLILDEALAILSDLVAVQRDAVAVNAGDARTMFESLLEMF